MRLPFFAAMACAALLPLLSGALRADTVLLADGTEHEGKVLSETANEVTFQIRMGSLRGSVVIPKAEIISLKYGPVAPDTVAADGAELRKLAEAETEPAQAAQAWLRVGEYYDRHPGYWTHARSSYEKALLFDPNQAVARARLGFVKDDKGGWRIPAPAKKEPAANTAAQAAPAAPIAAAAPPAPIAAAAPAAHGKNGELAIGPRKEDGELAIGLRKDAAAIKKLLDDGARRVAQQRAMLQRERAARDSYDNDYGNGYGNGSYYLLSDGLYYYPAGSSVFLTSNGVYGYPYGGYGYGNACGYRNSCGYGYGYGSSLSVGVSGRIGNVHVRGGINTGSCRSGSGFRGGFRF